MRDSHPRPAACRTAALTAELIACVLLSDDDLVGLVVDLDLDHAVRHRQARVMDPSWTRLALWRTGAPELTDGLFECIVDELSEVILVVVS